MQIGRGRAAVCTTTRVHACKREGRGEREIINVNICVLNNCLRKVNLVAISDPYLKCTGWHAFGTAN